MPPISAARLNTQSTPFVTLMHSSSERRSTSWNSSVRLHVSDPSPCLSVRVDGGVHACTLGHVGARTCVRARGPRPLASCVDASVHFMYACMHACVCACVCTCVCVCVRARARVRAYGCKHAVCIRVCIRVSIWQRQERAARQGARSQSAEFWPRRTKIWDINAVRERRKHTAEFGLLKILLPFPVGGNNSVAILLQAHAQMRANKPSSATHQHLDALAIACAQ